ncbi:hypothetical protein SUGI_0637290 [Cryptomeria japonica]|nr:hypothetical protein SUGI_0637290 [Cryptomeria japonica]
MLASCITYMHTHVQLQVYSCMGCDDVDIVRRRVGWGYDDVDLLERTATEHAMSSALEGLITRNRSNRQETAECFVGQTGK